MSVKDCPVCKLPDQRILNERDYGDKVTFECERCGRYTVSGTSEAVLEQGEKSAHLSGWLRERNLLGIDIPILTPDFLKEVIKSLPEYKPLEKQRKLLVSLQQLSDYPGKEVVLMPLEHASLSWAENEHESRYYIRSLVERGLIDFKSDRSRSIDDDIIPVVISAKGWEYLDEIESQLSEKSQAFIAMAFDDSLLPIFEDAIKPAVEATGYKPYRVDKLPHLDKIDAKIIAEIRNSRFVIADVTLQKAGVYYEAGFAHGLGIPVIWCVQKDDLKNVHFDTRQYNHILWETQDDLKQQLIDFILATIGKK